MQYDGGMDIRYVGIYVWLRRMIAKIQMTIQPGHLILPIYKKPLLLGGRKSLFQSDSKPMPSLSKD